MERMSLDVNKMTKDQLRQHILMLAMELTQLEEENKKLREEREMLIEDLSSNKELYQQIVQKQRDYYEENRKLKEELKETEDTLFHRDGVLSIMYDLVRSSRDEYDIVTMISSVIDDEC